MKTLLAVLAFIFAASGAWAQTNTNHYVPKAADMRIVDGKMYNRMLSRNWTTLPQMGTTLEVFEVVSNGVVLQSRKNDKTGEKLLVMHYPVEQTLAKGKVLTETFRAMRVESVKYGTETVPAYDYGLPNTVANRKTMKKGPISSAPQ